MKQVILVFTALIFGLLIESGAQSQTPVVDQRQQNQKARIVEGASSGELTRRETAQSLRDQRRIKRTEHRAKSDGVVKPGEKANLERKQNKASRQLRRNKHDAQQQP
ncbi:MAG: hypothetical protein ABI477_10190 [Chryseolinea sp.]